MTRHLLVFGLFASFAFAGLQAAEAQTAAAGVRVAIDESQARALLSRDSIQLDLPLRAPAGPGLRAVAWLLSPVDTASGETAIELREGSRWARFTLPWPRDGHGDRVDQIGWHRIRYRIEARGAAVAQGILAIGAIAPNLMALRLARPEKLISGMPLSVRAFAGNPITRQPFRGVRLKATLEIGGGDTGNTRTAKQTLMRLAATGAAGEAILNFPIQIKPGQSATLKVEGTLAGPSAPGRSGRSAEGGFATASVTAEMESDDRTVIHLETDKPLHKPGETVHLRALVFDDAGRAAAGTALSLTIKDPEDKKLLEIPLTTNRFGIAAYDWKTGPQTAVGDYEASIDSADAPGYENPITTRLRIERYELPEFAVTATMDRAFYLYGQTPAVWIHAGYLFGKPVAAGSVRVVRARATRWNSRTGKFDEPDSVERSATLNAQGDARLDLDVKADFEEFLKEDYARFKDIAYRALVTDATTGRSEPRNFTVRLTRYPVHIYLRELRGDNREGDYLVSTSYADGAPAACKLTLDWMDENAHSTRAATLTTNRFGLAKVHLRYPQPAGKDETTVNLRLTARDAQGRNSKFDDMLNLQGPRGPWISVEHSLLRPNQPIEATLHGTPGRTMDVDVLSESGLLAHLQVRLYHKAEPLTIPATEGFHGLITLRAYQLNGDLRDDRWGGSGYNGLKSVLYPEDRELKLKLTGLQTSYGPGAEVDARLAVQGAAGPGIAGALGVAVVDTAVEQRAATEEEANEHSWDWNWWQQDLDAGGVTRASLDRTDTSQPIPEDLQLAAEAVLDRAGNPGIEIEGDTDETVRGEYESAMARDLKPLGEAVLAARKARLPATADAVQAIARAAKLDDALLLDPWNTPYKVEVSSLWNEELVSLSSAGPDKRFGTGDDFSIALVRRNLFALPGERLIKLLQDAVDAGKPLPGTLDGLKELSRAGGLELDSAQDATLAPNGRPYRYEILVQRRFYSVQVSLETGEAVWTSPQIDYFSRTESRMEAAIRGGLSTGKLFPNTAEEARQAFAAAGIDFDALRDPMGKPFRLRSTQVLAYARVEQVKAAENLQATGKKVTHLLRAIQILRSPDPASADAAPSDSDVDLVAQFLHPVTEQSGSDLKPQAVDEGTFKGNTGAIGGTVTDQTGAAIAEATVTVKTSGGVEVTTGKTLANGSYLVRDLAPGFYTLRVESPGFQSFVLYEIYVSPVSLTGVDVEMRVGAMAEAVQVNAVQVMNQTESAQVVSKGREPAEIEKRIVAGPNGRAAITESTFTPRLRHVFEETAFWAPSLETDAGGRASLHFNLPDSLTTWKLHALASTVDGRIGALDQTFRTFQPFFVDLDAPQVLTVGDEVALPVNLRNYTAHALALPVTVKAADWFTLLTPASVQASVPANGTTPAVFGFRAAQAVEAGPLRITAANAQDGDAVEKTVRVHPDGEPRAVTASRLLRGSSTAMDLDLPAGAMAGSLHAELLLYPNLGAQILHSMKAVLERPYGCGEQTISSTYPSLLYLELLKASKGASPMEDQARTYLQLGYDRLLGYFDPGGGLTYWGESDHNPDPALTAYGIELLTEAGPFVAVDRSRIAQAQLWLLSSQQADGSWKPHYGSENAELNLYIAQVLARNLASDAPQELRDSVQKAVARAVQWAANSAEGVHDPYANALRLLLSEQAADSAGAARLRAELASAAIHDREGAHWMRAGSSPFYGWGRAGELETTALVVSALEQGQPSAEENALLSDALFHLLRNQDRYGVWLSGQATVRVLRALLPMAEAEMARPASIGAGYSLTVNGVAKPFPGWAAEPGDGPQLALYSPRLFDLTALLHPGHNELVFAATGYGASALASAEVSAGFYVPWAAEAPLQVATETGKDAGLDFGYRCGAQKPEPLRVGQEIDCMVDVRRFGSQSYGMLLAEVGLPPGSDVDRVALGRLVDNWTISRYELQPDRIVFYLWSWRAEGTHFSFRFTPRYALRAKAAPSTLEDYYNPDLKVVLAPRLFDVQAK